MVQHKNTRTPRRVAGGLAIITALLRFTLFAVVLIGVHGCISKVSKSKPDYVEVSSLDEEQQKTPERMTQAQLGEEVERFAFRYTGRLNPLLETLEDKATTPEERMSAHHWKKRFAYSIVEIAIGRDPVIRLLDMVALATLIRIESEEKKLPEVFSGDQWQTWLTAVRQSEEEIWSIAEKILDPKQQTALRELIRKWRIQNTGEEYVTSFRFSDFAAEAGAEEIESLVQTGGLLPEVSEATRAADEIRQISERALLLAFVSPHLARLEAKSFMYDLATQPEFKEYRTSLKNFSEASTKLTAASDKLPAWISAERQAAVDQAMDRLFDEGDKLFAELDERSEQFKELLGQIRETLVVGDSLTSHVTTTMTTIDSLVTRLDIDKPASEKRGFRIKDYRETLAEAAVTAGEINKVLQSLDQLLNTDLNDQTGKSAGAALQALDRHIERWIWLEFAALACLVLFMAVVLVGALLVYRWSLARFGGTR